MDKKNNKINILHLISSLQVGGAEKLLIDLLKNTESKDINFTVVVMNDKIDENLKKELLNTGYKIYFLNRKESHKHPKYFFQLNDIIKKHKINIVHSHNYGGKHWAILCKILKPNLKIVHTIHDSLIIKNSTKINIFLHKYFIDKSIAISKTVCNECISEKIFKVIQIYNGVKVKKFNAKKIPNKNIFNIINIARIIHQKKGQDILIKALKECKNKGMNFRCNFVGGVYDYDQGSFEYLKKLVNEFDLQKNINFLGNREDIPELLAESDLFILPSRYEGLGLVLLEAMAAGVPIIASNIDGPAELIEHEKNGLLFESENHLDLADKIFDFYNNEKKRELLAENAYKFVQDFDISVMSKKYCKLYLDKSNYSRYR